MNTNDIEITAGAIRATARTNQVDILTKDVAYAIWDEMARTKPQTIAGITYNIATDRQSTVILNRAIKGYQL